LPKVAHDPEARIGCKGGSKFWYGYEKHVKPLITQALVDEEIELQQAASGADITPEKIQMAIKNLEKRNRMAPGDQKNEIPFI